MRKYFIPLVAAISMAGAGCKKDKQIDELPTQVPAEKKAIVSTIAGDGTKDFLDGPALSAKFKVPYDVAVGNDGTIYIADAGNRRIREISNDEVFTLAGNGTNGIVNANGRLAQFRAPYFIALDANGNLFTLDISDSRIRKISPAADVSTYAGTATPGFADGPAATASI
jgi:hypothetical protein